MTRDDSDMSLRRHELLESVHDKTRRILEEHGVDASVADQAGCALADELAEDFGGQNFFFPMDSAYKVALRDIQIYEDFTGKNYTELSRRYKMSVRGIYKVIKRVRAKGDPNQPRLF